MIRLRILMILGMLFVAAGCSDDDDDGTLAPGDPSPVSFATDIQPLFNSACVRCHGDGGLGGLDLREGLSYGNLVGIESQGYAPAVRVVAEDPAASVLHEKMANTETFGGVMPPTGALSSAEVELVRRWIEEGANP